MKIFSWMQSKLNGKQGSKKPNSISANHYMVQEPCKEEFRDWPHGLLAIGTFGNKILKEDPENRCNILQGSQDHVQDIYRPEEGRQLEKELTLLLLHKQVSTESSCSAEELETHNLQLDNFNFPASLESKYDTISNIDTTVCVHGGDSVDKSDGLQRSTSGSVILNTGKDIHADHTKNAIGKKSLCFLLEKMFLCQNGIALAPTPSLRDPIPDKSIMEKILRAILHKKIYPQNSSSNPKATAKKYLEISHMHNPDISGDEMTDTSNDGSKWVKTDSEFIVLEI